MPTYTQKPGEKPGRSSCRMALSSRWRGCRLAIGPGCLPDCHRVQQRNSRTATPFVVLGSRLARPLLLSPGHYATVRQRPAAGGAHRSGGRRARQLVGQGGCQGLHGGNNSGNGITWSLLTTRLRSPRGPGHDRPRHIRDGGGPLIRLQPDDRSRRHRCRRRDEVSLHGRPVAHSGRWHPSLWTLALLDTAGVSADSAMLSHGANPLFFQAARMLGLTGSQVYEQ